MADRYKLLKEAIMPGGNAVKLPIGHEFVKVDKCFYRSNCGWVFRKELVENNPDWFQKIEEDPIEDHVAVCFSKKQGYNNCLRIFIETMQKIGLYGELLNFYTEADLTQARIDAFNAAREVIQKGREPFRSDYEKYDTVEDYLQSLNNK